MQEKNKHTLFVAHSHNNYVQDLTIFLSQKGYSITTQTGSGIDALQFILQNQPEIAVLEAELPVLSALDIIRKGNKEELKIKFVVVFTTKELALKPPLQYAVLSKVSYCNKSMETLLKVLVKLHKPKNRFWNFIKGLL
jgi:CheY-like chemotaxis protein